MIISAYKNSPIPSFSIESSRFKSMKISYSFMPIHVNLRRHARREKGKVSPDVPLTKRGKVSAFIKGLQLRFQGVKPKFYTSDFVRTQQTGRLIAKGAGSKYNLRIRNKLSSSLVRSPEMKEKSKPFYARGEEALVDQWLKGELPADIFRTPHETAIGLLSELHLLPRAAKRLESSKRPNNPKTIHLEAIGSVPHMMALVQELTGKKMVVKDQLKFLEPVTLTFGEGKVHLQYRNEAWNVTSRFHALMEEAQKH